MIGRLTSVLWALLCVSCALYQNELELWKSDGTPAGTALVRRLPVGYEVRPSHAPLKVNDNVYFVVYPSRRIGRGHSYLWKSDGTPQGTGLVKTIDWDLDDRINPAAEEAAAGDRFFFVIDDEGGSQLWVSDGTTSGTIKLLQRPRVEIYRTFRELTGVDRTLFFIVNGEKAAGQSLSGTLEPRTKGTPQGGVISALLANQVQLWKSDGSPQGTVLLKDLGEGPNYYRNLVSLSHHLFFWNGGKLWRSDGTPKGTEIVKELPRGINQHHTWDPASAELDGTLFFGSGHELWKTDGTSAGTVSIKKLSAECHSPLAAGRLVFFLVGDLVGALELWKSDGTSRGTSLMRNIRKEGAGQVWLADAGGTLLFVSSAESHGTEPWTSDGTSGGTKLFRDLCPGPCSSMENDPHFRTAGGQLFFQARIEHPESDRGGLFRSDGTPEGTVLIMRGAYPWHYGAAGREFFWIE